MCAMKSDYGASTTDPLSIQITLRVESREDYWVGAIKGLGIVVRSDTYDGVTTRAVSALNFLLEGLQEDGIAPQEYFAQHGIDCKPLLTAPHVSRMNSKHLFSLNGTQEIPLEGTLHVGR